MESSDQQSIEGSKTLNDVMYRRLKNRERQRRYRERKRLQTDPNSTKSLTKKPSNGSIQQVVTRVHCVRDWKKDARRVHVATKQEAAMSNPLFLKQGNQEPEQTTPRSEVPPANGAPTTDDHEKVKSKRRRRDWKAEARNRK